MQANEVEYAMWRQHPITRELMLHLETELTRLRSVTEGHAVNGDADKTLAYAQQAFSVNQTIKWITGIKQ